MEKTASVPEMLIGSVAGAQNSEDNGASAVSSCAMGCAQYTSKFPTASREPL